MPGKSKHASNSGNTIRRFIRHPAVCFILPDVCIKINKCCIVGYEGSGLNRITKYVSAIIPWIRVGIDRGIGENKNLVWCLSYDKHWRKKNQSKQSLPDRRKLMLDLLGYHVKFNYNSSPVSLDLYELLTPAASEPLSQFRYQDTIIKSVCNKLSIKVW